MDFLDVTGASGAIYRFRRAALDELPATAGNLIVVTGAASRRGYRVCAAARSLAAAGRAVRELLGERARPQVYVRLNVSRTLREAEHADIVAAHAPEHELPDLD